MADEVHTDEIPIDEVPGSSSLLHPSGTQHYMAKKQGKTTSRQSQHSEGNKKLHGTSTSKHSMTKHSKGSKKLDETRPKHSQYSLESKKLDETLAKHSQYSLESKKLDETATKRSQHSLESKKLDGTATKRSQHSLESKKLDETATKRSQHSLESKKLDETAVSSKHSLTQHSKRSKKLDETTPRHSSKALHDTQSKHHSHLQGKQENRQEEKQGSTNSFPFSSVTASSGRVTKDAQHLYWQTQVLFESFLHSHCCRVDQQVCSPVWLMTRLYQCYCLAAGVPHEEVVGVEVPRYIEHRCAEKYQCKTTRKGVCVVGVAVYTDSPLYTLWRSKATLCDDQHRGMDSAGGGGKRSKSTFTKCVMVNARDAMSGIRFFMTDAGDKASTGKFVARATVMKLQQRYCCDYRQLNRIEFGHVMCKGNGGIKTSRPQCRIMPHNRKNKQEYHYSRVEPRTLPLLTRGHLGAAIQQRGFTMHHREKHHLMRHAHLHAAYYSGLL